MGVNNHPTTKVEPKTESRYQDGDDEWKVYIDHPPRRGLFYVNGPHYIQGLTQAWKKIEENQAFYGLEDYDLRDVSIRLVPV